MATLTKQQAIVDNYNHLMVPLYYMPFFGMAKLFGVLGMWSPFAIKKELFREGAQWGVLLYFLGATLTHILAGDEAGKAVAPAVLTALALASMVTFQKTRSAA